MGLFQPGGTASLEVTWPWCLLGKMMMLQLQIVPKYWAGVSLWCVPPPRSQGRVTIQKSAGRPDPVAPETAEGPIEQHLYRLQADSPRRDEEMKGTEVSPILRVESAAGCLRALVQKCPLVCMSLPQFPTDGAVPALTEGRG